MTLTDWTALSDLVGLRGSVYVLTSEDVALAEEIGHRQHVASGSRGSRGAGANIEMRVRGATGEIVVARLLGIEPQVRALSGPDMSADITYRGLEIEVKAGRPMVWCDGVRPHRWYVAVVPAGTWRWQVLRVVKGRDIIERAEHPPEDWCPRPGTRELNWRF